MNSKELGRYNRLIARATGFFRRDAESKFQFAAILAELVGLTGDAGKVSNDLGMSGRREVEGYIAVGEFWGSDRIPDFPMQPARWSHYRNVVFNQYWYSDPKLQAQAKQAALKGGNYEVEKLEQRLKAKAEDARRKAEAARPQAVKDEERRNRLVKCLKSALFNARVWANLDDAGHLLRPEDRALLFNEFEALTLALVESGVVPSATTTKRRTAA